MGFIDIEAVKKTVSVVEVAARYTQLRKKRGNCPMCNAKGSFVVNDRDKEGSWINLFHCFACNKGGSIIDLVMEMEHTSDAREAAVKLCVWFPAAEPCARSEASVSQTKSKRSGFYQELDIWLTELLLEQPQESREAYMARVKKAIATKVKQSYDNDKNGVR